MFFFSFLILCLHGYKNVCQVHDQTDFLCLSLYCVQGGKNKLVGELQDDMYQSMIWHLCIFSRSFRKIIENCLLSLFCPFLYDEIVPCLSLNQTSLKENAPDFKSLATIPLLTLVHQVILQPFTTQMELGVSPLMDIFLS